MTSRRYTQKGLRGLVAAGVAVDVTGAAHADIEAIRSDEGGFTRVGHAEGTYGCSGLLVSGRRTGKWYAAIGRCSAVYQLS